MRYLILLALAIALIGCGGSDGSEPPLPPPIEPEPPAEPDRPVEPVEPEPPEPEPEPEPPLDPEPPPPPPLTQQERWLDQVNTFRGAEQLCPGEGTVYAAAPPVRWDGSLELAAIAHSADMAAGDFLSHTGSDSSHFASRAFRFGYTGSPTFEVIAAGSADFEGTLSQWIGSRDGHCGHLMRPETRDIGAGFAFAATSTYGYYWTLVGGVSR